jgi:hypothetical protein
MVDEVLVVDPGRARGHACETRQATIDVLHDARRRRAPLLEHVFDQINAPSRAIELVAE